MVSWLLTLSPAIKVAHLLSCILLVVSILLQAGKGTGLGAAFGVGASQTVFGAQGGAKFLSRLTIIGALIFCSTALLLALVAKTLTHDPSALPSAVDYVTESAPATPPPPPAPQAPVSAPAQSVPATPAPPPAAEAVSH